MSLLGSWVFSIAYYIMYGMRIRVPQNTEQTVGKYRKNGKKKKKMNDDNGFEGWQRAHTPAE